MLFSATFKCDCRCNLSNGPLAVSHQTGSPVQAGPVKKPVIKWEVWHNSCLMVGKQQPGSWRVAGPSQHQFSFLGDAARERSA